MNEVKRYDMTIEDGAVYAKERKGSGWVSWCDYDTLQQQLTATTNSLTNAQEALKSAGIKADTVQAGVMELVSRVDGISHECGMMMGLLNDVYRYHEECTHDDMMHALIPLEYVSAINGFVERDVDGENPCPITDAYLNAVRADAIRELSHEAQGYEEQFKRPLTSAEWQTLVSNCWATFDGLSNGAQLRAGKDE